MKFLLSDQPPLGSWKIVVELENNVFETTFEIKEYGKIVIILSGQQ